MKHGSLSVGALLKNVRGTLIKSYSANTQLTASESLNGSILLTPSAGGLVVTLFESEKNPTQYSFFNYSNYATTISMAGSNIEILPNAMYVFQYGYGLGGQHCGNANFVVTDTYANIISTYSAADYSGRRARATDSIGFDVVSNGTTWIPQSKVYSGVWSGKPSIGTYPAGSSIYITNVGAAGGGSNWQSDGVIWRPQGRCVLQARTTADTLTGADAIFEQQPLLAGFIQPGLVYRMSFHATKSNTAQAATFSPRLGTAGTTADALLLASATSMAAVNKQIVDVYDIVRLTATTIRIITTGAATAWSIGTTVTTDITVPDMDANALLLSLSASVTTETLTNKYFSVEVM